MMKLTEEQIKRGVVAQVEITEVATIRCLCEDCTPTRKCTYCNKKSGYPVRNHCRHCGYPSYVAQLRPLGVA